MIARRSPSRRRPVGLAWLGLLATVAFGAWLALSPQAHWPAWQSQAWSAWLGAMTAWLSHLVSRAIALRPGSGMSARAALARLCWAWMSRWLLVGAALAVAFRFPDGLHAASLIAGLVACLLALALWPAFAGRATPPNA